MTKVLNHMYRLAILHDVSTYVMLYFNYSINPKIDRAYDKKLNIISKKITKYSYVRKGKIIESRNCFLSSNDNKAFEMFFGKTDKEFNPTFLIKSKKEAVIHVQDN